MIIEWHGYTYEVCHDGERYVAIDRTKGRDKRRLNFNCWRNIHDGSSINPDLTAVLEGAVSQIESQHAPRKFGPVNGKAIAPINPLTKLKGRMVAREKRNGRVSE